jgi:hypothetical protein
MYIGLAGAAALDWSWKWMLSEGDGRAARGSQALARGFVRAMSPSFLMEPRRR